jgi:hypothetical protein
VGTGQATSWNPGADGVVYSVLVSGSSIYVGGSFSTVGMVSRSNVAAVDASSGITNTWNPVASGNVYSIAVSGSRVFLGGEFLEVGGLPQSSIASILAVVTGVEESAPDAAGSVLGPPAPNPFGASTSIRLSLLKQENVTLRIFDVHGRQIQVLASGMMPAGNHVFGWDGRDRDGKAAVSGVYFCELKTASVSLKRKLVLVR